MLAKTVRLSQADYRAHRTIELTVRLTSLSLELSIYCITNDMIRRIVYSASIITKAYA